MSKTDKLERELNATRERLSATLDELRYRAKPERVAAAASERISHSMAADFVRNLKADVVSNSVPLTLLAAGLSWLMFKPSARNQSVNDNAYVTVFHWLTRMSRAAGKNASRAGLTVHSTAASAQQQMAAVGRRTVDTGTAISNAAQNTVAATKDGVASAMRTAQSATGTVRHSAASVVTGVSRTARGTAKTAQSHPALFAATALAVGGAAAMTFFLGRSLREEIAHSYLPDQQSVPQDRALAVVDEPGLDLIPKQPTDFPRQENPAEVGCDRIFPENVGEPAV